MSSTFRMTEAQFDLPDGWQDQSVQILAAGPPDTAPEFSFVVSRQPIPAGKDLDAFVTGEMELLKGALSRFRLLRRVDTTLDGVPAVEAEFTWSREGQPVQQHQTYLFYRRIALTLTASALLGNFPRYNGDLQRLLASFELER
ncbi:MAG: DcrB-related protein [Cytophagales bacterium]|nr:DcrB-related protein [Armatimonadota bacterium]